LGFKFFISAVGSAFKALMKMRLGPASYHQLNSAGCQHEQLAYRTELMTFITLLEHLRLFHLIKLFFTVIIRVVVGESSTHHVLKKTVYQPNARGISSGVAAGLRSPRDTDSIFIENYGSFPTATYYFCMVTVRNRSTYLEK
jgi:hypothetical protein